MEGRFAFYAPGVLMPRPPKTAWQPRARSTGPNLTGRTSPVELRAGSPVVNPEASRDSRGGAGTTSGADLAACLRQMQAEGGVHSGARYYEEDPVAWCLEKHPHIESKDLALVPFVPWPFQEAIMRYVWEGRPCIIEKARQLGVSTAICVAFAHLLLYRHASTGVPCHGHIFANTEDVALDRLLGTCKLALFTADLTEEERNRLEGAHPNFKNNEIRYNSPYARNYLRAHTSNESAGRSFDGNAILLEEFAKLNAAKQIWTNIQPMVQDLEKAPVFVVSTPYGADNFFTELCDNAEDVGLTYLPFDWRSRPGRDEAWKARSQAALGITEGEWDQEFDLHRLTDGSKAINMEGLRAKAAITANPGDQPLVGHRYAKGIDLAGSGGDECVCTVVDVTGDPAVTVFQKALPPQSAPERIASLKAFDRLWPGPCFVDGTNDTSVPGMMQSRTVVAVRIGSGSFASERVDKGDHLKWRCIPRSSMRSWLVSHLETGRLVVHEDRFKELWRSLDTAVIAIGKEGGKAKRRGRFVDRFDSLMLANLGIPRHRREGNLAGRKMTGVASSSGLSSIRGRKW